MPANKKPLISILIPAYNHEKFIGKTLDSVLDQTYDNIELCIIDDGSPDSTNQIILDYKPRLETKLKKLNYLSQKNSGTLKTLNKCIEMACGDYYFLFSSDDLILPNAIETLVNSAITSPEHAMIVGDSKPIDDDGNILFFKKDRSLTANKKLAEFETYGQIFQDSRKEVDFKSDEFGSYESLLKGNYIPNGFIIKASAMKEVGSYNSGAKLEDWHMNMQLAKKYKIKFVDKVLFLYRSHDSNTMKRSIYMQEATLQALEVEKDYCYNNGFQELWEKEHKRRVKYVKKERRRWLFSCKIKRNKVLIRLLGKDLINYSS